MDGATGNVTFGADTIVNSGGSQKLYNLGTEGDADTEYLDISATSNIFSIYSKATGTGVVREVTIGNPDNRFRSSSTGVIFTAGGSTRLNITSNFTYLGSAVAVLPDSDGTIELGRDAARWQNVASVDGDFSGTVTTNTVTSDGGNLTLQRNGADSIAIGGSFVQLYNEIRPASTNLYSCGTSTLRWSNVYSVDGDFSGTIDGYKATFTNNVTAGNFIASTGQLLCNYATINLLQSWTGGVGIEFDGNIGKLQSGNPANDIATWDANGFNFSGNLNVEPGGSYKIYNLGTEGDADTEYLEISHDGTRFKIDARNTGNGSIQEVGIGRSGSMSMIHNGSGGTKTRSLVPQINDTYVLGSTNLRYTNIVSVDGDFSGDLTIGSNVNAPSGAFFQYNNQNRFLLTAGGTLLYADLLPSTDGSWNIGESNRRFAGVHGVNGSFSGNIVSEVGGTQRLYNLGTEGDTDTEYFETMWAANNVKFRVQATGTGSDQRRIDFEGSSVRFIAAGIAIADISAGDLRLYSGRTIRPLADNDASVGKSGQRFTNVYSYDGDFSGTVTTDTIVGTEGQLRLGEISSQLLNLWNGAGTLQYYSFRTTGIVPKTGSETLTIGNAAAYFKEVRARTWYGDNLVSEVGGSYKLYGLGTEGDADTEYLETNYSTYYNITTKSTGAGSNKAIMLQYAEQNRLLISSGELRVYKYLRPSDTTIDIGSVANPFRTVYSVDGDFSGILAALEVETGTLRNGGSWYLKVSGQSASPINLARDTIPYFDDTYDFGSDSNRWSNVYSVDGSFSGNLNVETGSDGLRFYSTGTDGDTDTAFLNVGFDSSASAYKVAADRTGAGLLRQLWFDASQIRTYESGTLLTIAESNELRMYGTLVPSSNGLRSVGSASKRFGDYYGVDGDFSGTVATETITGANGTTTDASIYFRPNLGDLFVRTANSSNIAKFAPTGILTYTHIAPQSTDTHSCGLAGQRWANTYSVDGSFSGSLVSEVSGSYKIYNLGTEGDTDTEFGYIEYDSGTGILKFGVDATGSGSTSRPVNFYTDSSFGFKATGGTTRFNISASNVVTYLNFLPSQDNAKNLGSDATRFARAYVNSGTFTRVETITAASDSLVTTDHTLLCDCTSNNIALAIPASSVQEGNNYVIKKIDSTSNTVTITPDSPATIDGAASQTLNFQHQSITLVSDGSNWFIV